MQDIRWDDKRIYYCGRMEEDPDRNGIRWVYPASCALIRFRGKSLRVHLSVKREYSDIYLGIIVDGVQIKKEIKESDTEITLAEGLGPDTVHEVLLFKRMDTAQIITIESFLTDDDAVVYDAGKSRSLLARELGIATGHRIEFFGDSVSCGEVSEAVLYTGKEDPEHNGEYSNSWYSYAWMTARKLHAEIHNTSQGGIALLDGIGWYHEPDQDGMESFYDKCQSNKNLEPVTEWDFSKWIPQVAVIAIGQNDSHPTDFMKEDYDGELAVRWREKYAWFIKRILGLYPGVHVVCTTTILNHDSSWDRAIGEAVEQIDLPEVHHFLYSRNGCGTPGHVRISEADQMSGELAAYIDRLIYSSSI